MVEKIKEGQKTTIEHKCGCGDPNCHHCEIAGSMCKGCQKKCSHAKPAPYAYIKTKREWFYFHVLFPKWVHDRLQTLFKIPLISNYVWFIACLCPTHLCRTGRIDEWKTRRFCKKCNDWWDLG